MSLNTEVVAEYTDALKRDLTFNSRPHIHNLTTIAKENLPNCREIVQAIAQRIITAPSNEKLPALYLMDSIIKNIGGPYISEFSKHIVETFCTAYESIKDNADQRNLYVRLLKTWVGPQFFPPQAIAQIEHRIRSLSQVPPHHDTGRNIHVNPRFFQSASGVTPHQQQQQHLQQQQRHLLGQARPNVVGPYTRPASVAPGAVPSYPQPLLHQQQQQQLHTGSSSGPGIYMQHQLPPQGHREPMGMIPQTSRAGVIPLNNPYQRQTQSSYPQSHQPTPQGNMNNPYMRHSAPHLSSRTVSPVPPVHNTNIMNNTIGKPMTNNPYAAATAPVATSNAALQLNIQDIFKQIAATTTATTTGRGIQQQHQTYANLSNFPLTVNKCIDGGRMLTPFLFTNSLDGDYSCSLDYYHSSSASIYSTLLSAPNRNQRASPIAMLQQQQLQDNSRLQTSEPPTNIIDPVSRGIHLLYDAFPESLQCSNCGLRFTDKNELNAHLDKHYRERNMKETVKVLSRKWYQSEAEWIKQADTEVIEDPGAIFFKQLDEEKRLQKQQHEGNMFSYYNNNNMLGAATTLSNVGNDNDNYIEPVIANFEQNRCPLCKDEFESKFDDDAQEWVFTDAVKDRTTGLVAHRVCMSTLLAQIADSSSSSADTTSSSSSSSLSPSSSNHHQHLSHGIKRQRDEQDGTTTAESFESDMPTVKRIKTS